MSAEAIPIKPYRWGAPILGIALAAVAALFFWARWTNFQLRTEIAELEARRGYQLRLQRDNRDLVAAISQLTALPTRAPIAPRPNPSKPAPAPLPPGFKSLGDLKNVGSATTADTFETYLWALDRGETDTLVKTLILSDSAQAEIDASFAKLPPAERAKYGSAEVMFALLYAYGDPASLVAMQTVDESPVAPDQVILKTNWQFPAGQIREHSIPLFHASDGWKIIVSDLKADAIIQTEPDPEAMASAPAP